MASSLMCTSEQYLDRILFTGPVRRDFDTLKRLNRAHMLEVPYETIDLRLGVPVSLAQEDVYRKVVVNGRGGYCYELNSLFGWLLRELGFQVTYLSASIIFLYKDLQPGPEFEHLVLLVTAEGRQWLVDVGHGGVFDDPIPLISGTERFERTCDIRLESSEPYWYILRRIDDQGWAPMYRFSTTPRALNDFNIELRWGQESPLSWYRNNTTILKATETGRLILCTDRLEEWQGRSCREETLTAENYLSSLLELFKIQLPESTDLSLLLAPDPHRGTDYGRSTRINR